MTTSYEIGGEIYPTARRATAAFLDWWLDTRSTQESTSKIIAELRADAAQDQRPLPEWMTDELLTIELSAALKNASFNDERATANLEDV